MSNIWEEYDKKVDKKGLQEDINKAKENNVEYKEVPLGQYEVAVEKMELKKSKNDDAMVSIWFKIIAGDYKGQFLFMNQVITQGFQIHIVNEFLRSLDTKVDVEFTSYSDYAKLLETIKEAIDKEQIEYGIEYGEKKGFKTFKITDVFEIPF